MPKDESPMTELQRLGQEFDRSELVERVALKLCEAHDGHLAGKSGCAVTAYQAGSPAVAYWNAQAAAAIASLESQAGVVEALREALKQALDMVVDACRDGTYSVSEFKELRALSTPSVGD